MLRIFRIANAHTQDWHNCKLCHTNPVYFALQMLILKAGIIANYAIRNPVYFALQMLILKTGIIANYAIRNPVYFALQMLILLLAKLQI